MMFRPYNQEGNDNMVTELKAQKRQVGNHSTLTALRDKGQIPAVVYGSDAGNQPIAVDEAQFMQVFRQQGSNQVIKLNVEGTSYNVMLKDIQSDPIKNRVLHLDFNQINMNEKIDTMVPIVLEGEAEGVKDGGVLQQMLREINIRCLPNEIPDNITVNVQALKIGDSVTVSDLSIPNGMEANHQGEEVVLNIVLPKTEPVDEEKTAEQAEAEVKAEERADQENSSGDAVPARE
jgi:large subunit ribosomal protein L25